MPAPVRAIGAAALATSFLLLAGCGGAGEAKAASTAPPSPMANDFGRLSPGQAKASSVTLESGGADDQDGEIFTTWTGAITPSLAHRTAAGVRVKAFLKRYGS